MDAMKLNGFWKAVKTIFTVSVRLDGLESQLNRIEDRINAVDERIDYLNERIDRIYDILIGRLS